MPGSNPRMSDLDDSDIQSLARILTKPLDKVHDLGAVSPDPGVYQKLLESRKRAVRDLIHLLPSHLKRSIFQNLSLFKPKGSSSPFCETHSDLNPDVVRMIFCFLELEVGMKLNTLVCNLSLLSLEQMKLVRDLRTLHALWYPPELYSQTFFDSPPDKWTFQSDRCKACMLARVGADTLTLTQLRTTLLARRQRHRCEPRLLRWVNGCIFWNGYSQEAIRESDKKAKALKRARRRAWRASGKRKPKPTKKRADETKPEAERRQDAEEQNMERHFEESILDCYKSSYEGSASDDEDTLSSNQQNNKPPRSAESQAEEYRRLLKKTSLSKERPGSQVSRQTRWSDLYSIK